MITDKRLIYTNSDTGNASVVIPSSEWQGTIEALAAEVIPPGVEYQVIDVDAVPTDRTFRDAWEVHPEDGLQVNMDSARNIQMAKIRSVRDEKLQALDIETLKAVGSGDTATRDQVEQKKQTLRDIPQTIDLSVAATPEELKAIWPPELD